MKYSIFFITLISFQMSLAVDQPVASNFLTARVSSKIIPVSSELVKTFRVGENNLVQSEKEFVLLNAIGDLLWRKPVEETNNTYNLQWHSLKDGYIASIGTSYPNYPKPDSKEFIFYSPTGIILRKIKRQLTKHSIIRAASSGQYLFVFEEEKDPSDRFKFISARLNVYGKDGAPVSSSTLPMPVADGFHQLLYSMGKGEVALVQRNSAIVYFIDYNGLSEDSYQIENRPMYRPDPEEFLGSYSGKLKFHFYDHHDFKSYIVTIDRSQQKWKMEPVPGFELPDEVRRPFHKNVSLALDSGGKMKSAFIDYYGSQGDEHWRGVEVRYFRNDELQTKKYYRLPVTEDKFNNVPAYHTETLTDGRLLMISSNSVRFSLFGYSGKQFKIEVPRRTPPILGPIGIHGYLEPAGLRQIGENRFGWISFRKKENAKGEFDVVHNTAHIDLGGCKDNASNLSK